MTPMVFVKSSAGRNTRATPGVPEVESLVCDGGGLHILTNAGGITYCGGCGITWAALDAVARGAA